MKLIAKSIDWKNEGMKPKNRQSHVYPPPNDGREWILLEDAAKLFGIKRNSMTIKANKLDLTRTFRKGVKTWLLKKEVMDYLAFLKDREQWYKRRRPKSWEPEIGSYEGASDAYLQRIFLTTKQAAAFMGVSESAVRLWVKKGRIPVFVNRKMGLGSRYWFSPTSLRNYKEDEERLKHLAIHEKGKETMRAGIVGREVYKRMNKPRVYKNIPPGWLTAREAADLLDIGLTSLYSLIKRGGIEAEHLTGKWDKKIRPWFISRTSLERYIQTEYYQRKHRQGKESAQKMIGRYVPAPDDAAPPQKEEQHRRDFPELAPAYSYDELMSNREERVTSLIEAPSLW